MITLTFRIICQPTNEKKPFIGHTKELKDVTEDSPTNQTAECADTSAGKVKEKVNTQERTSKV
jgi:hypothetical protein